MSDPENTVPIVGTVSSDVLTGTNSKDVIIGLDGNDQIDGGKGDDVIYGDFVDANLLTETDGYTSFAQYGESGAWTVQNEPGGHTSMTQTIHTAADATYTISFELAANYGAGSVSGAVEVLWNGEVIHSFDTNSATFSAHDISFEGTGGPGSLTFRSIEPEGSDGPEINTDGPVFWYEKTMEIGGEDTTVKSIAEGQTHIYQVFNGTLHLFDVETETYQKAGTNGSVNVNALGYNQEDDMLYAIAVGNGVDSQGNAVSKSDLMMFDAEGNSYLIGSTPYRSWTGDFDDKGNLWVFNSSLDWINMIDVDQVDADGNVATQTFKLPRDVVQDSVWDVAYDATTQTFTGIVKPKYEGGETKLLKIDVSGVAAGGEPVFETIPVTHTLIDGELFTGAPHITFGAAIHDADGNLYVGGNSGDHDMDDSTGSSGGIYLVVYDEATGTARLELVSDAPRSSSNDGAADPRAMDPFTEVDQSATVLIRSPEVVPEPDPETPSTSYDDTINGLGGQDEVHGDLGEDTIIGDALGDTLHGDKGDDHLFGGAGPDWTNNGLISVYDEQGNRFDQYGNPLPEDDDVIFGGEGNDYIDGSAGHDTLDGGVGDDTINGGSGNDIMYGGQGVDTMSGGANDDTMHGGDGNDYLHAGSGDNTVYGGAGDDEILSGAGQDYHDGGNGNDSIYGGNGDDILIGGAGEDTLRGGSDNDQLIGGADNDVLDGGTGNDHLEGGDGYDRLKAGSGDDTLNGGEGNDYLAAWKGDDVLDGGAGKDRIYLGAGDDIASGGSGADKFIYRSDDLDGSTDTILDFRCDEFELDCLDLRSLNLVENESQVDAWLLQYVTQNDDNNVEVDLLGTTIALVDHQNLGADFMDQVNEGIWLI